MSIAFDTATNASSNGGGSQSHTFAHTVTGVNPALAVGVNLSDTTSDIVTSVTYGGAAMTQIGTLTHGSQRFYLYLVFQTLTGANNVVVLTSSNATINCRSASYTGTASPKDNSVTNTGTAVTTLSGTLTTGHDNAWTVGYFFVSSTNTPTNGSGTTQRATDGSQSRVFADSNGAITPAGSTSLTLTFPSGNAAVLMVSLSPFLSVVPPPPQQRNVLMRM